MRWGTHASLRAPVRPALLSVLFPVRNRGKIMGSKLQQFISFISGRCVFPARIIDSARSVGPWAGWLPARPHQHSVAGGGWVVLEDGGQPWAPAEPPAAGSQRG